MNTPRATIAGAGIGGLCTALALLRRGWAVQVLEQASQLGELGAGVQLSPNGTRVLRALGLQAALEPLVCEAARKEVRHYASGRRWKLFDLGADCRERFGAPYWMVHRGDLHRVLLQAVQALAPDAVQLNARVTRVTRVTQITGAEPTPITGVQGVQGAPGAPGTPGAPDHHDPQGAGAAGVTLHLADGTQRHAEVLLACDGVHSALRQQLLGEDSPRFTGLLAWRGLVPMQALPSHLRMAAGEAVGTNWVGPGGHVITYPVRGGALMNVVGILERDDWRSESWTQAGTTEELLRDFTGWHADVQTLMAAIAQPFKWALLSRAPRTGWAQGRVCLLGDAAHPTLPFLAQGANMAIEDAAVMARCLDDALRPSRAASEWADVTEAGEPGGPGGPGGSAAPGPDGPGHSRDSAGPSPPDALSAALRRFEALRWQRTADIVNRSSDNAKRFHNPRLADPAFAEAYIDSEWDSEKVRRRYDWLFAYDALSG